MQVIKTETVVYEFSELNDDAKQNAIDSLRDINTHHEWWDCTIDHLTECLECIGFSGVEIAFSGFWSQGDGARFTGQYSYEKGALSKVKKEYPEFIALHELAETLQELNKPHFYSLRFKLGVLNSLYCHENTSGLEWSECDNKEDGWPSDDTDNAITDACREFMQEIYTILEKEHEFLTSDNEIIEAIKANGYQFTSEGAFYG